MISHHLQLPEPSDGLVFYCTNTNNYAIIVKPNEGATINHLQVNETFKQPAKSTVQFICASEKQWFTLGSNA